MDSARCHLTSAVKTAFKKTGTLVKYIPGGMTPILQPLDVHLNKPVKSFSRSQWEEWMLHGEEEFTKSGYRKRASYQQLVEWVSDGMASLDINLIQRSFKECGVSSSGVDDVDELHSRLRKV